MKLVKRLALLSAAIAALAVPTAALGSGQLVNGADNGVWGVATHNCGGQLPVFIATAGNGTLGPYAYSAQECANLGAGTYSGTFTIVAGGGTLSGTYAGTFRVDRAGQIHYQQTNTATGGTGAFSGASGSFTLNGLAAPNGACFQRLSGSIDL
jgi:hypothetical protein